MTTQPRPSAAELARRDDDIYDSDTTISRAGKLADLLRDWNAVVRAEAGHAQSFDGYDGTARSQQRWHQILVIVSATAGTVAVLMAILQLAAGLLSTNLAGELPPWVRTLLSILEGYAAGIEYFTAILALISVLFGLAVAFHNRWRLLRFKAEQYRFTKFNYLLHGADWLSKSAAERIDRLETTLAALHALDHDDYKAWALGSWSLLPHDPPIEQIPQDDLTADMVRYFLSKRIGDQRRYFERRGHELHTVEHRLHWVSPACFFVSIAFALIHFGVHVWELSSHADHPRPPAPQAAVGLAAAAVPGGATVPSLAESQPIDVAALVDPVYPEQPRRQVQVLILMTILCLLLAAAVPIIGAGIRTYRAAFEFGRNGQRFLGLANFLSQIDKDIASAQRPLARILLLYRTESALIAENRAWNRLMLEAEWFG